MALEIRMVDQDGTLVRTLEDVTVPALPTTMAPGTVLLADYCFNENGPWVKPEKLIGPKDLAAVVYNYRGNIESMMIGENCLQDEEDKRQALHSLRDCLLTKYPGKEGNEVYLFYLSPRIRGRLRNLGQKPE